MPDYQWASQAYQRNDYGLPPERLVNMFPEKGSAPQTGEQYALVPREGRKPFANTGEFSCQGGFQQDGVAGGKLITVHNTRVYATDKFGVSTLIGTIDFPIGLVRFAAVRNSIVILAPSGNAFRTDGTLVSKVIDADLFPNPVQDIASLDLRIVYALKNSDQFFWSEVLQSDEILGLSFATAERGADPIVGIARSHQELFIFGTQTTEAWAGTGETSEFAFARIPGAAVERGCSARNSILTADNTVWFLGENGIYYRLGEGFVPLRVSTHAIEEKATAAILRGEGPEIQAWTYAMNGHEHIGLRFPQEGTFVYDISSDRWWEAATFEEPTYSKIFAVRAFNGSKVIVGEVNSGKLSELSPTTFDDDGAPVERLATLNVPVTQRVPASAFRVHVVEGHGLPTGQGSNPEIMLDWSDDGEGRVWSKERRFNFGQVGQFAKRIIARACGQIRPPGRIWRVRMTDPVSFSLRKASLNDVD